MNQKIGLKNRVFDIFIIFLIILVTLPILAPILLHIGFNTFAQFIYDLYSLTCHQFHWRSIHVYDHQMAWCVRDTFIWSSFLITSIGYRFNYLDQKIKWYWLIPFMMVFPSCCPRKRGSLRNKALIL